MIIKGKSRSGPTGLAKHLGNAETNERISLLETRGTVANDLKGALIEMDAYAVGTQCQKPLYHAAISPGPHYRLTPKQREEAINALEDKLGLTGHSRVVVLHEKLGREHIHVVWSRIDLSQMRSVSDSHNYRKHEEVARDLERRFNHERVQGAHHEREGVKRPERTPSRAELRQEERTGIKGKQVRAEVTAAFRGSDSAEAFKAALEDAGYILAQGDRRDFIIVDRAGGIHSLARRIEGMNASKLREFMSPIDREQLPDPERAKELAEIRAHVVDEMIKARRYSRGADYVSHTQAGLKDFKKRQSQLDKKAAAIRMFDYGKPRDPADEAAKSAKDSEDRERREREERSKQGSIDNARGGRSSKIRPPVEITDRMARLLDSSEREEERGYKDDDPDRQRKAPGGGRTRSR